MTKARREDAPAAVAPLYDVEGLLAVGMKVKSEGFVPASALREAFGDTATTQAIALLYRDFRLFSEARRPWGDDGKEALGYQWANRRFSRSELKKIPASLGFVIQLAESAPQPRYGGYVLVTARCRWTVPVLGSVPVKDANGDPTNLFERDERGDVVILRYGLRAMASKALPVVDKPASVARHIRFRDVVVRGATTKAVQHGIVDEYSGGKGVRNSEQLPAGTEFSIAAKVPTTEITVAEYVEMLREAGASVGLSPGRSAGFGDFEVVEVA